MWARCFAALGIEYKGATMTLDLCDRDGKYSNGEYGGLAFGARRRNRHLRMSWAGRGWTAAAPPPGWEVCCPGARLRRSAPLQASATGRSRPGAR